MRTLEVIG